MSDPKLEVLRRELNVTIAAYNASLGAWDREVEAVFWRAARDAAQKAFDYQADADEIRARRGSTAIGDAEARSYEVGADCFREMSQEFIQQANNLPKAAASGLPFVKP
jgi:hypothetical protein